MAYALRAEVVAILALVCAAGCARHDVPHESALAPSASTLPPDPGATGALPPTTALPAASTPAPAERAADPLVLQTAAGVIPAAQAARILHVGDSMVPLVANYLRQLAWNVGRDYWVVSRDSSTTLSWSGERALQEAMYQYDPEVILISLGSNELFVSDLERRAEAIRQLVRDTRSRPCLWIGPPAWKKDRGFLRVLVDNLGHCRYLDSTRLELPRMRDGRHPDWTGGHRWSVAVWQALGGTEPVPRSTNRDH